MKEKPQQNQYAGAWRLKHLGVCDWQKSDFGSVFGSVFALCCLLSSAFRFTVYHCFVCLYGMTLEMMCFRIELVQLIVSRSDSELQVQRYGMKKNALTVNPIMLQDEL